MSFARKSDIRETLTRVVICSMSQLRMRSLAACPRTSSNWAINITTTNDKLLVPIPTSTMFWEMKGMIRLSKLPTSIASNSWTI